MPSPESIDRSRRTGAPRSAAPGDPGVMTREFSLYLDVVRFVAACLVFDLTLE